MNNFSFNFDIVCALSQLYNDVINNRFASLIFRAKYAAWVSRVSQRQWIFIYLHFHSHVYRTVQDTTIKVFRDFYKFLHEKRVNSVGLKWSETEKCLKLFLLLRSAPSWITFTKISRFHDEQTSSGRCLPPLIGMTNHKKKVWRK